MEVVEAFIAIEEGSICRSSPKFPKSSVLPSLQELGFSLKIPLIPAGEKAASKQLASFFSTAGSSYDRDRDFPDRAGTSRLSPYLSLGAISPRTVVAAARKAAQRNPPAPPPLMRSSSRELAWRDFYRQILWHFPHAAGACFQPRYDALKWENNERYFAAWCEGRTGYPIVDAGMRQLNATRLDAQPGPDDRGHIPDQGPCLSSWQWGERYFMQKLFDADLASNNGGWQWSAGTGTDAQALLPHLQPDRPGEEVRSGGKPLYREVCPRGGDPLLPRADRGPRAAAAEGAGPLSIGEIARRPTMAKRDPASTRRGSSPILSSMPEPIPPAEPPASPPGPVPRRVSWRRVRVYLWRTLLVLAIYFYGAARLIREQPRAADPACPGPAPLFPRASAAPGGSTGAPLRFHDVKIGDFFYADSVTVIADPYQLMRHHITELDVRGGGSLHRPARRGAEKQLQPGRRGARLDHHQARHRPEHAPSGRSRARLPGDPDQPRAGAADRARTT